jgi:hypothetical protein
MTPDISVELALEIPPVTGWALRACRYRLCGSKRFQTKKGVGELPPEKKGA